ncbi:hypothetical protein O181_029445 [Austropuccinia psidii MF-1]|uniref:Reverse transcriptase Ty1/copia-type domain-containing protein n=1 Tax=Austropuccinia psidii MF-1 TaxID=1389203 RepID=A0A9Q3H575_9BASI|nr:hypothetical protein [Austropuccinia psidii MF-1]
MKDLGELRYVLGMTVERNREKRSLFLSQELYISNLLATFGMQDCKSASTPQVPGSRLLPRADTNAPAALINYWCAIGLLNYLVTCTRPDLAYSASCLAQFLNDPSSENEAAFKHVLRYLSGTQTWGISLGPFQAVVSSFMAWWGGKLPNRMLFLSPQLKRNTDVKAKLLCDNQGAIALLKNPLYQHRTRHIKLRLHWCRQLLNEGDISMEYVATNLMVADVLTKGLSGVLHQTHCAALFIL